MSEMITEADGHAGRDACAVVIRPKTTHGWRPISVKIQPTRCRGAAAAAATARPGRTSAARDPAPPRSATGRSRPPARPGAEADHQAERPVGHRDVRLVVARARTSSRRRLDSLMPCDGAVRVHGGEQREQVRAPGWSTVPCRRSACRW